MSNSVIAITGPAGAGKSTVGEKVAKQLKRCVNIDADHIKHMIVGGFHKDTSSPGGWGFDQWGLVGDSIGLLAANFLKQGYSVIINGYIDEPAWTNIEKLVAINHKFLLLPSLETIKDRDAARNEDVRMGKAVVSEHHEVFSKDKFYSDFIKIDTSNHSVEETVSAIIEKMRLEKYLAT